MAEESSYEQMLFKGPDVFLYCAEPEQMCALDFYRLLREDQQKAKQVEFGCRVGNSTIYYPFGGYAITHPDMRVFCLNFGHDLLLVERKNDGFHVVLYSIEAEKLQEKVAQEVIANYVGKTEDTEADNSNEADRS